MDVDPAEGEDLIAELTTYLVQPDHQFRHVWRLGDIIIWDNRCALHRATGDYPPGERRLMWRATIMDYDWQEQRRSA
jgi:taurine dioxygenase